MIHNKLIPFGSVIGYVKCQKHNIEYIIAREYVPVCDREREQLIEYRESDGRENFQPVESTSSENLIQRIISLFFNGTNGGINRDMVYKQSRVCRIYAEYLQRKYPTKIRYPIDENIQNRK